MRGEEPEGPVMPFRRPPGGGQGYGSVLNHSSLMEGSRMAASRSASVPTRLCTASGAVCHETVGTSNSISLDKNIIDKNHINR